MKISSFGGMNTGGHDYHTIPGMSFKKKSDYDTIIDLYQATSVAVERVFSQGRLVLPYVHNRLSAESI
jgi:hypothetical protein